ncbi:MAG TPA: AMP-binding protein [Burkholderiaceae bacterium]|nr:AMP-binding protein [Burkholderiaceae bacterium]
MTTEALIGHRAADARIAVRAGAAISAGRLVADAVALAKQLPPARYLLNTCRDRYFFAVGFCVALFDGRTSLLPPSRAPEILTQLVQRYPDTVFLGDDGGRTGWCEVDSPPESALTTAPLTDTATLWPPPAIAREHIAAIAFTSGSTGEPQAQWKTWGGIVDGARAEVVALRLNESPIEDVVLVGTVSPQHMYGLESTVLLALHGPCAFAAEHPLHPDEVVAVLSQASGRRLLITAPVHLRALAESANPMPALDRVVSATAPLASTLAARCESMWDTRVFEIYGCTETGMIASRRTVDGPVWTTMIGVKIEQHGAEFVARGGHVQPGPLADRLRLISPTTFEMEGRADDMVNIGGKRASLEGLNRLLLSIDGVSDGAIFFPPAAADAICEQRLMALVVAPHSTREQVLAALRTQIDAAFLPRPLLLVDALPRNAQGKLPRAQLLALAERVQHGASPTGQPKARSAVARRGLDP